MNVHLQNISTFFLCKAASCETSHYSYYWNTKPDTVVNQNMIFSYDSHFHLHTRTVFIIKVGKIGFFWKKINKLKNVFTRNITKLIIPPLKTLVLITLVTSKTPNWCYNLELTFTWNSTSFLFIAANKQLLHILHSFVGDG